jgi:hypothetical protein
MKFQAVSLRQEGVNQGIGSWSEFIKGYVRMERNGLTL